MSVVIGRQYSHTVPLEKSRISRLRSSSNIRAFVYPRHETRPTPTRNTHALDGRGILEHYLTRFYTVIWTAHLCSQASGIATDVFVATYCLAVYTWLVQSNPEKNTLGCTLPCYKVVYLPSGKYSSCPTASLQFHGVGLIYSGQQLQHMFYPIFIDCSPPRPPHTKSQEPSLAGCIR